MRETLASAIARVAQRLSRCVALALLQSGACLVNAQSLMAPEPGLHVLPAPSDNGMYLSWIPLAGSTTYSVKWRAPGDANWRVRDIGTRNHAFIPNLVPETSYTFIVGAKATGTISKADTVVVKARNRAECSFQNYYPPQSFFCSQVAADQWLRSFGVRTSDLRCRNEPVTDWGPDAPDCMYTAGAQFRMLLLRNVDKTFASLAKPLSVVETRNTLRRAIWPDSNPFNSTAYSAPIILPQPRVGKVNNFKTAQSLVFDVGNRFKSRVTRFTPNVPVNGHYAIFHEGHGVSGTVGGADMIEFLLMRGWEVYAMDMPLEGENFADATARIAIHFDFWQLENRNTSILSVYMLPVKQLVDFIAATRPPATTLLMMGRSGGGMTSYVYGALDERVTAVVSVAGGRPMSQRLDAPWGPLEIGDTEQYAPEVYASLRHEDLMIAAGSRGGLFLYNTLDPCCFRVSRGDPFISYLENGGVRTGRTVRAFVDPENKTHGIGPAGFVEIDRFLASVAR